MVQKEKVYTALKYLGAFLLCTVLFLLIMSFISFLDNDKMEMTECFLFENGIITKTFDYQSYLQGYCAYLQVCACAVTSAWIQFFYILSLPIFILYEILRRKIILYQYSYLCVLGEIAVWALLWYYNQYDTPYGWFAIDHTYDFIAPMAIIMLTLHALPPKVLKVVSIIIGTIYGLYVAFWAGVVIINMFNRFIT